MANVDDFGKISVYTEQIKSNWEFTEKTNNKLLDGVASIEGKLGTIVHQFNDIANVFNTSLNVASFAGIAKQLWEIDSATTKISMRIGMGKQGIEDMKESIDGLTTGFGASLETATDLVTELAKSNYKGNLQDAAKASYLFSDATGLSTKEAVRLTDQMSKVADMSEKSMVSMYAGITKVQQANGISEKGMSLLSSRIIDATNNMVAFGRSQEQIKQMAVETSKFVSVLEEVGIAAETSLNWIERLTDPDKIEENIGLYAQLGISMSDALSGGNIEEQMLDGMKSFAQKLKEMGPIAGAQYANAFGLKYKDVIKAAAADTDIGIEAIPTAEEESLAVLQELSENTQSYMEQFQRGLNKIVGMIRRIGPVVMSVIAITFISLQKIVSAVNLINKIKTQGLTEEEIRLQKLGITIDKNMKAQLNAQNEAMEDYRVLLNMREQLVELEKLGTQNAEAINAKIKTIDGALIKISSRDLFKTTKKTLEQMKAEMRSFKTEMKMQPVFINDAEFASKKMKSAAKELGKSVSGSVKRAMGIAVKTADKIIYNDKLSTEEKVKKLNAAAAKNKDAGSVYLKAAEALNVAAANNMRTAQAYQNSDTGGMGSALDAVSSGEKGGAKSGKGFGTGMIALAVAEGVSVLAGAISTFGEKVEDFSTAFEKGTEKIKESSSDSRGSAMALVRSGDYMYAETDPSYMERVKERNGWNNNSYDSVRERYIRQNAENTELTAGGVAKMVTEIATLNFTMQDLTSTVSKGFSASGSTNKPVGASVFNQ